MMQVTEAAGPGGKLAERPRVAVVLPRGEAIRNFVYSGALDRIAQNADLTVFTIVPNEQILDDLRARFDAVVPIDAPPRNAISRYANELAQLGHGRRLDSEAARERVRLR